MCYQRRGTSVRTLSTDVGRPSPHFDIQPFSPYPVSGNHTLSRTGSITRYNLVLGHLADRGDLIRCLKIATQMKAQGVKPDILTYNCLIRACGREVLSKQAIAIYEDMLAAGLQPERETFHLLFKVSPSAWIDSEVFADSGIGPFTRTFGRSADVVE